MRMTTPMSVQSSESPLEPSENHEPNEAFKDLSCDDCNKSFSTKWYYLRFQSTKKPWTVVISKLSYLNLKVVPMKLSKDVEIPAKIRAIKTEQFVNKMMVIPTNDMKIMKLTNPLNVQETKS